MFGRGTWPAGVELEGDLALGGVAGQEFVALGVVRAVAAGGLGDRDPSRVTAVMSLAVDMLEHPAQSLRPLSVVPIP